MHLVCTDLSRTHSLVEHTLKTIGAHSENLAKYGDRLLPTSDQWTAALRPFLNIAPNPSIAITDRMASAVYIAIDEGKEPASSLQLSRDWNGYSVALRMAMYVTQLIRETNILEHLDAGRCGQILEALLLTLQLANDNVGIAGANNLWVGSGSEDESDIVDFVSEAQILLLKWLEPRAESSEKGAKIDFIGAILDRLRKNSGGTSAFSFYNARAMCFILAESALTQDRRTLNQKAGLELLKEIRKVPGT